HQDNPELQVQLAQTYERLGGLVRRSISLAESLAAFQRAHSIRQGLARDHPESEEYRWALAKSHAQIREIQRTLCQTDEELRSLEFFLFLMKQIKDFHLMDYDQKCNIGYNYNMIGHLQIESGQAAAALRSFREARDILEEQALAQPTKHLEARKHDVGG